MILARKSIKAIVLFFLVIIFLAVSFLVDVAAGGREKLRYFSRITSFFSRLVLIILGVEVKAKNLDKLIRQEGQYLIVSNHLSYTDVFVICSIAPSVFIANSELTEQFVLGTITRYSGAIFVERRNKSKLLENVGDISDTLNMGLSVTLFPEGTTSNGDGILNFKTSFFHPAIKSRIDILPVCLRYKKVNGAYIDRESRDAVFFYGEANFFSHFFRILEVKTILVEFEELEVVRGSTEITRKNAARLAYERISDAYKDGGNYI